MDGRDPRDRRCPQPSIRRRLVGSSARGTGAIDVTTRGTRRHAARTPPSPSRSRRRRDHRPTTASPSPPPPAPCSTSPASCRNTSSSRPSTRPSACASTARSQTGTRRRRAPPTSARSRHPPTPEDLEAASPPSSMTAVSHAPDQRPHRGGSTASGPTDAGRHDTVRIRARRRSRPSRLSPTAGLADLDEPGASRPGGSSSSAARRSSPGPCRRRRTWSRGRSSRRACRGR